MRHSNAKCSFCRKSYNEVGPIVEGPDSVYICVDCAERSQSIIEQEKRRRNPEPERSPLERLRHSFAAFVESIPVITNTLLAAVGDHYQAVADDRPALQSPILIVGPSRASRHFIARAISQSLAVPLAIGDQQSLIQTNKAFDSNSLLYQLLNAAEFDLASARHGMIYLDGFDDKSVQHAFMNLLDAPALPDRLELDLYRVMFICGADADGLDQIISTGGRHLEQPIEDNDLIAWGMMPSFVNRLHFALWSNPLDEDTFVRILSTMDVNSRNEKDA